MAQRGLAPALRLACARLTALCIVLVLAGGCMRSGDFGRGGPGAVLPSEDPAITGSTPASTFALSDDERQLRDLARNLLASPREQSSSLLVVAGTDARISRPDQYVDYLVRGPFRSASARYSRLVDDTRNDILRLEPFFLVARRVADLDGKRDRSLQHVTRLTQDELINAKRRMRENMMLIAEVRRVMVERAAMYRIALERLVITLPSPLAVEAERQRIELERRLAEIQLFASEPRPVAMAPEASRPIVSK